MPIPILAEPVRVVVYSLPTTIEVYPEGLRPPSFHRRMPRRLSVAAAGIGLAMLGVAGALGFAVAPGLLAGQFGHPAASLTPIPSYAAVPPRPITFGTKLTGVTVSDPTNRIKTGLRVIWVAHLSQPSTEPSIETSISAIVSGKQILVHRELSAIGLNGILTASPGVNSRDLGVGEYIVRYTSRGTILAEGKFTVVE